MNEVVSRSSSHQQRPTSFTHPELQLFSDLAGEFVQYRMGSETVFLPLRLLPTVSRLTTSTANTDMKDVKEATCLDHSGDQRAGRS
jgi:hypothetical protein